MEKVIFNGNDNERFELIKALSDNGDLKKGAYTKVVFKSKKKALSAYEKANGETVIEKVSEGVARFGIKYQNTASYKNKIIDPNQEPSRNGVSQYDSLVSGYENLLIETNKDGKVSHKIKIYTSKSDNLRMTTKWYLNGKEVDKSDLDGIMCKSTNKGDDLIMFTVKLENLISIGG